MPGYAGYVASKHAEIGLTKSAALDYADRGVRVNAVCPGLVNTPLIANMVTENPGLHEHLVAFRPLGRIAEPEEVADSIVWLATSKSSYVTRHRTARRRRLPRALTGPESPIAQENHPDDTAGGTSIDGHHRRGPHRGRIGYGAIRLRPAPRPGASTLTTTRALTCCARWSRRA